MWYINQWQSSKKKKETEIEMFLFLKISNKST